MTFKAWLDRAFGPSVVRANWERRWQAVSVASPEGPYQARARMVIEIKHRPRVPWISLRRRVEFECEQGVPYPTKMGEKCVWTAFGHDGSIQSLVDSVTKDVAKYRLPYGAERWRPIVTKRRSLTEYRLGRTQRKALRNTSKGQRTIKPLKVEVGGREYELHPDGATYRALRGGGLRKVEDEAEIEAAWEGVAV